MMSRRRPRLRRRASAGLNSAQVSSRSRGRWGLGMGGWGMALAFGLGWAVAVYGYALVRAAIAARVAPGIEALALGAVVNFFDTLGIGSFATTTAWFKFRRMVPDRLIPQTMLCGLTPPAMTESIVFLILLGVGVDPVLLFSCVIAVFIGGLVGVPLVTRARVWVVQTIV